MRELHFFDPHDSISIVERRLPHWSQAGVLCFITFRTHDSLSVETVERFHADRKSWLLEHGLDPQSRHWRSNLRNLSQREQREFYGTFSTRWHDDLDRCEGACVLANGNHAETVRNSLLHFNGDRYDMIDFIIMPNHAHLLVAFLDEDAMLKQCESWKHYTAHLINQAHGTSGRFWQQDGFDHLVRSPQQFEHFRHYIADNPIKAGILVSKHAHYCCDGT